MQTSTQYSLFAELSLPDNGFMSQETEWQSNNVSSTQYYSLFTELSLPDSSFVLGQDFGQVGTLIVGQLANPRSTATK